ncbi:MAG TPA: hypothetical protein VKH43_10280 [Thermoanaerobaculia bacterium]|nr:hypothetical protein [Thermoanaerobaculia bacterium]
MSQIRTRVRVLALLLACVASFLVGGAAGLLGNCDPFTNFWITFGSGGTLGRF